MFAGETRLGQLERSSPSLTSANFAARNWEFQSAVTGNCPGLTAIAPCFPAPTSELQKLPLSALVFSHKML
jgi:hypothetical protein